MNEDSNLNTNSSWFRAHSLKVILCNTFTTLVCDEDPEIRSEIFHACSYISTQEVRVLEPFRWWVSCWEVSLYKIRYKSKHVPRMEKKPHSIQKNSIF